MHTGLSLGLQRASRSTVKSTESMHTTWPEDSGISFCESRFHVIQTTSTLKTLGVALGGNCGEENALQEQRDRCFRLLKVALAINRFRADSLRKHDSLYPMRLALVLSDSLEHQRAAVRSFKEDFLFHLHMEERAPACLKCFVMLFGGKTRMCVCSSCCGIDRVVTKSTMKPSSSQNECSTTKETLA